ncbi:hypothetical protein CR157_12320 [Halomonas sp. LBP4]|nr:hypothetical protein CR157_12320 [Halomonas sp. LBP4]
MGMVLSAISPVYAFPILLVAAALNYIGFVSGVHFGWILIAGCAAGCLIYAFLWRDSVRIDASIILIIVVFIVLEASGSLFGGYGRLDRLAALLSVLVFIGFLGSARPDLALYNYFRSDVNRAFIYLVGSVGIILVLVTLSMLSTHDFRMARAGELSLAIGDTESSPRSLSNILGLVVVTCVSAVFSLPGKISDKIIWGGMGLAAFVGMFYTGSRMPAISTIFGLSVAVIIQLVFLGKHLRVVTILWIIAALVIVIAIGMFMATHGPGVLPFIDSGVSDFRIFRVPTIESNVRLVIWSDYLSGASVPQILFGSGIGAMGNPHSLYIGTLGTFGVVGIAVLGYFIFTLAMQAFKVHSTVAVATLAYILLALSSSSDVDRSYFWVMTSVVILAIRLARSENMIN